MSTDDLKALISAALADEGPVAALTVLRHAAEWAALALATRPAAAPGTLADAAPDDVAAFQAVVALDDALERLADVGRAVPALVEAASPGRPVQDHLREQHARLAAVKARLAATRAELDELRDTERETAELAAEHSELRDRLAELRRLRRLADEVDELRAQQEALTAEAERITSAEEAERATGTAAGELLRLTRDQLALLEPRVRQSLEKAAAAQAELAELREQQEGADERIETARAELAGAAAGFERLRERHEQIAGPLRAHLRADRELGAALASALDGGTLSLAKDSGLERAERELAAIEARLDALDEILGRALAEHARAHEEARVTLDWR
ncbi:hypothetical protein [Actinomadura fibrosa]|uniref:Chromosome partition protein Smc n=1 Tax=Actinomadura fibrosa TaxID=111802 RepID=A0ABW2XIR8_9ACTN|nr:hypothetical protein [Actinomadura fibrosa]